VSIQAPADTQQSARIRPRLPHKLVVAVVLGTLLNALNSSMIAVALVGIGEQFRAGPEVVWLVSGLYLATAVAQPTMGRLADRLGPRRVFCAGLVIVGLAALAAPFAPSLGWLVAARVALGVGTSAAYPAGLAMINHWAQREKLQHAPTGGLGAISIASQVAVALGPSLGGILVLVAGWRSIFWVNAPVVAAALLLALVWLPSTGPAVRQGPAAILRDLDLPGVAVFVGGLVALLLFLLSVRNQPDWPLLLAAVALGGVLFAWERHAPVPFIDVRMLASNRALTATYARTAVTYVVFYSIFYGLPAWLEQGRGMSSAQSGLVMMPIAGLGVVTTLVATRLSNRRGLRPVLVSGSIGLCAGTAALLVTHHATPVILLVVIAGVLGMPNGFNSLGNQAALYESAPTGQMGIASGLYRTSQYVGANFASALIGLTLGAHASDSGLHHLAAFILCISAGLLLAALASRHLRTRQPSSAHTSNG
jgi:MFS family permease